nr:hypothetical protein [Tanacetum cinerariifolium]
ANLLGVRDLGRGECVECGGRWQEVGEMRYTGMARKWVRMNSSSRCQWSGCLLGVRDLGRGECVECGGRWQEVGEMGYTGMAGKWVRMNSSSRCG